MGWIYHKIPKGTKDDPFHWGAMYDDMNGRRLFSEPAVRSQLGGKCYTSFDPYDLRVLDIIRKSCSARRVWANINGLLIGPDGKKRMEQRGGNVLLLLTRRSFG